MNDQDLDKLLKKLNPPTLEVDQIQQWKRVVMNEHNRLKTAKRTRWIPLAFAAGVGFVLGSIFQTTGTDEKNNSISPPENATIEFVYIKK